MITVKLSYSILNAWMEHKFEDAINMYLGKPLPDTPYLELGKVKHEIWAKYTQRTRELHPELGGGKLTDSLVEQKWQKLIPFNSNYQILIRGIIDLESVENKELTLTDYKCGIGKPSAYVDKWQLDLYKLLRPQANMGRYICHDPYKCDALCSKTPNEPHQCYTVGIKFLSDKNAEKALENIYTFGGEIIQYLEFNKLIQDYKLNG